MTAVASPPSFSNINRPTWGISGNQPLNSMNADEVRGMFVPRKTLPRTNSSSSVSSTSSTSSTATVASATPQPNGVAMPAAGDLGQWQPPAAAPRKRPQPKLGPWQGAKADSQADFPRLQGGRPPMAVSLNGMSGLQQTSVLPSQGQIPSQAGMPRPGVEAASGPMPVLSLLSLNGTFDRKQISVPFYPDTLRIGRQTNAKTVPTPNNGFFDSKVLSRQHAEIWADRNGKIWIRDVKSSNGTFVNGTRLSQENRESDPHELQTQDHLELGIDIVSEDQKTVVHHKVAAKVEHAGFPNNSSNPLDMNFGDLDPSNSAMLMPVGPMQFRRGGNQLPLGPNGRPMPVGALMNGQANGIPHQRPYMLTPITTEHIIKKLHNELRNARLQSQDLSRTGHFVSALLSKEDIKNQEKLEGADGPKPHIVNGNGVSFRADGGKTRFSDPPAPPPQQPLPEKPDVVRQHGVDTPGLKRGTTERPKSHPSNSSPIRPDNVSQILQLTEALNSAKREIDSQTSKMRELEQMLQREREAREHAEVVIQKLEDAAATKGNGEPPESEVPVTILEEAFEPPLEHSATPEEVESPAIEEQATVQPVSETTDASAIFQARVEAMVLEIRDLKSQLLTFRQRAEIAESERDADRKTLVEMVIQIRQRDEEARRAAEEQAARTPPHHSRGRSRRRSSGKTSKERGVLSNGSYLHDVKSDDDATEEAQEVPNPSRANTITPFTGSQQTQAGQEQVLVHGIPYASMIGVVLLGMGLMAYLNGWQPQPSRLEQ